MSWADSSRRQQTAEQAHRRRDGLSQGRRKLDLPCRGCKLLHQFSCLLNHTWEEGGKGHSLRCLKVDQGVAEITGGVWFSIWPRLVIPLFYPPSLSSLARAVFPSASLPLSFPAIFKSVIKALYTPHTFFFFFDTFLIDFIPELLLLFTWATMAILCDKHLTLFSSVDSL